MLLIVLSYADNVKLISRAQSEFKAENLKKSEKLFIEAEKKADIEELQFIYYYLGLINQKNSNAEKALDYYKKASHIYDVDSMIKLATFYYNGWGVKKSIYESLYWLAIANETSNIEKEKIKEQGNETALANLKKIYKENKTQIEKDAKANKEWPNVLLGYLYQSNVAMRYDKEGKFWYIDSLHSVKYYENFESNYLVQYMFGKFYIGLNAVRKELGSKENEDFKNKAFKFFKNSYKDKFPLASLQLGKSYLLGTFTKVDHSKAKSYLVESYNYGIANPSNRLWNKYKK